MIDAGIRMDNLAIFMAMLFMIIIYLAWMVKYKAKAKERLLMIEKDFDENKLLKNKKNSFNLLKTGIILLASSIGAIIGLLLDVNFPSEIDENMIFVIAVFMFAGIGMIIANKVDKPKED
ncbi:hypothetical protein H2O64_13630 [Kordia sp. YSTF-M3]|uniref:DUF6249 domain-containing protein n=1 Tax=Kordia aestuariivivens TaxID=2759037 RepID=A0ABR7QAW2_9FLAO|nr:DUF6249 domain-containing protein [Kordia aestuariivivens]MBC8755711.1 hypothetical protein [Kordia aestuariivivens]